MLSVIPFHPDHLALITGKTEVAADIDQLIADGATEYLRRGPAYTFMLDGEPVWSGGLVVLWPGVAEVWGVPSTRLAECSVQFHRLSSLLFRDLVQSMRLRRVQCTVNVVFAQAIRWIEKHGFEFEGVMRQFGPDGADHYRYALLVKSWAQ